MCHLLRFLTSLFFITALCHASTENSISPSPLSDTMHALKEEDVSSNATYALLQWVDKFTGKFQLIYAKVGETTAYQRLRIRPVVCGKSAQFEPPESKSLMTIWEHSKGDTPKELFSGWMFASSPALSTLINHPRYNLWLVKCTNKIIQTKKEN